MMKNAEYDFPRVAKVGGEIIQTVASLKAHQCSESASTHPYERRMEETNIQLSYPPEGHSVTCKRSSGRQTLTPIRVIQLQHEIKETLIVYCAQKLSPKLNDQGVTFLWVGGILDHPVHIFWCFGHCHF